MSTAADLKKEAAPKAVIPVAATSSTGKGPSGPVAALPPPKQQNPTGGGQATVSSSTNTPTSTPNSAPFDQRIKGPENAFHPPMMITRMNNQGVEAGGGPRQLEAARHLRKVLVCCLVVVAVLFILALVFGYLLFDPNPENSA